jgi:hypothetical protein
LIEYPHIFEISFSQIRGQVALGNYSPRLSRKIDLVDALVSDQDPARIIGSLVSRKQVANGSGTNGNGNS